MKPYKTSESERETWKRYYARTRAKRCADSRERYHHLRSLGLCTRCKEPSPIGVCYGCRTRSQRKEAA